MDQKQQGGSDITLKKIWFIKSNQSKIQDVYDIDPKKVLGTGTYGNVYKAKKKQSKIFRAIKIIPKKKVKNQERFKREIDIMRIMDHPNIIKLYETFEDEKNVYLVMEVCEGGELFERIIDKGQFTEVEARQLFKQIVGAINYCHKQKIAHRDLKPENFLFLTKHEDSPIKVIDFGLSKDFSDGKSMSTKAGTPYYISPEVLKGSYDHTCDIWSVGVILYIILSGVPPFYGDTDAQILEAVKVGEFSFDIPEFKGVSEEATDLIKNMITKPESRLTAEQILQHKWLKYEPKGGKQKLLPLNFNALKNFTQHHKLKKVALTYIASQLSENEISDLGRLFRQLDKNGDGVLTIEEIQEGLSNDNNKNFEEIKQVIASIDTDGSGKIDYTEFLAATMEKSVYMKQERLLHAFRMLDLDGSGKISPQELKEVLGSDPLLQKEKQEYWDQMIKEVDKNGDGEVDFDEFIEMMNTISLKK